MSKFSTAKPKRPYNHGTICECGSQKCSRSLRCRKCQHAFDKRLRRPLDSAIYFVYCERLGIVELCRKLRLTKDQCALISVLDYKDQHKHNRSAWWNADTQSYYAKRDVKISGKRYSKMLQTEIYEHVHGPLPSGKIVDHRNKISLDCRRSNLREADKSKNMCNSGKRRNNTSGYKGVTWDKRRSIWIAQIALNKKHYNLGDFATKEEAYAAYCKAALSLHGEFANLG